MKKLFYILGLLTLFSLFFTGCSKMSGDIDSTQYPIKTKMDFEQPSFISQQIGTNLFINCTPNIPQDFSSGFTDTMYVNLHLFDAENATKALMDNETIVSKQESYNSSFGISAQRFQLTTQSGKILNNGLGYDLYYTVNESDPMCIIVSLYNYIDVTHLNSDDFSFEPKESTAQKLKDLLLKLNINVSSDYTCYSLDHNTLRKVLEENSLSSPFNIDESFDSYVFYFTPTVNNIPISSREYGNASGGNIIYASGIRIIYNRNGIIELSANQLYDFEQIQQNKVRIISVEQALQSLIKYYDQIMFIDPLEITKINLEYLPTIYTSDRSKYLMKPVWNVTLSLKEDSTSIVAEHLIDATTGELIE